MSNLRIALSGLAIAVPSAFVLAEADIPPLADPGTNGYLIGELIYPLEDKPTKECHASTLAETPTGLVAAWFGGTNEKDPDVGIWVSRQVDGIWSRPVEAVNGVQSMNVRYPCWNPVLFQPRSGPLMLYYKVGPDPRNWWGMLTTSSDGGTTWSWPEKLGTHPAIGHLLGPVKNKPIQLSDGAIMCPSSTERINVGGDRTWKVHFEITRDLGKSWEVVGPINDGVAIDAIQPSILTYKNGDMQILCRSRQQVVAESWSRDGGQTWSEMNGTALPNPNAGTDSLTLHDGRQLIVYNHTIRGDHFPSGRNMLNAAFSNDGMNWHVALTFERSEGEFSYPAVIQTSDGRVHITYTYKRESVKHVVLEPGAW
jgi:predicted neuraminidase